MSGITLGGLNVPVVELQLVGSAGMTERMKDHIRKLCISLQASKCVGNDRFRTGASIWQRNHKVIVKIFAAEKFFLLVL